MVSRADLRKQIYEEFKEILDATNKLVRVAQSLMVAVNQKGGLKEQSYNHEKAAAILFSQAYGRFLAVKVLCEDGMGDAALIVLRSLLNLFFIFHWILAKHKESRGKRYMGWYWRTWKKRIQLEPANYDAARKREVRRNYRMLRHLYTYRVKDRASGKFKRVEAKFWYSPWTIERMAKEIGLEQHYEDGYRILSWAEHIDPNHAFFKIKAGQISSDPLFDKRILNECLVMNFSYFREICATIDKLFSLGKTQTFTDLADQQKSFKRG